MAKKAETTEIAAFDWDAYDGNTGLENISSKDIGIPILHIVQKNSPEIDEDHPDHAAKKIEGVKVGDIINSTSRAILPQPTKVVPYFYFMGYNEWRDKKAGGGLVAVHKSDEILRLCKREPETNKDILPNGNYISTTAHYFVRIIKADGSVEDALLTFSSTQLKKSKAWLNMMKNFRAANGNTLPMFHRAYYLTTVPESNAKGTWRGWKIEAAAAPLSDAQLIADLVNAVRSAQENSTLLLGNSATEDDIV